MATPGSDDAEHSTDETLPMPSGEERLDSGGARAEAGSPDAGESWPPSRRGATTDDVGGASSRSLPGGGEDADSQPTLTPEELDALDTPVGQVLAQRYRVLDRLGSGGMAIVYRARHETLRTTVAVKVLKKRLAADRVSVTRFHREAMAAASVGNPHIVHIIDYGFTATGDAFIVMEYLEGQSLRQLIRGEGPLAIGRAVSICRQTLRGLDAAHGQGIVHRDLKGDNVFITCQGGRDFVKLLDFGISKVAYTEDGEHSTGLTSTGVVMGTPQYISPEQASGLDEVDHRADIYALGAILYEMLTGQLPFEGRAPLEILMKHVQEIPVAPGKRRPDLGIPPELDRVVLKALQKDPADRYATAAEMQAALPEATALPGGFASGPLPSAAAAARRGRFSIPVIVGLGALVLLGAVGALLALRGDGPRSETAPPPVLLTTTPLPAVTAAPIVPAALAPDAAMEQAATVKLRLSVQPSRATIFRDDQPVGTGSVTLEVPRGEVALDLDVRAPGHKRKSLPLMPDREREVEVVLEPLTQKRPRPRSKKVKEVRDNPYQP